MLLTRVLEKKSVIQAFGGALVLAPIVNTLVKMSTLNGVPEQWTFAMFTRIIAAGSVMNQILYVATIALGFLMLRGSTAVWKWALLLLGGYIGLQVSDFKHVKSSGLTWTFFITNIAVFMFIADQLVFNVEKPKQKPQDKQPREIKATVETIITKPTTTVKAKKVIPANLPTVPGKVVILQPKVQAKPKAHKIPNVNRKILFQFAGQNPWGQLLAINSKGLQIKALATPPAEITEKEIDLCLTSDLKIRTKLSMKNEDTYFFDYANLSKQNAKELNHWLSSLKDSPSKVA